MPKWHRFLRRCVLELKNAWAYYERPKLKWLKTHKVESQKIELPSIARARFGSPARFCHSLFTESQMVEEIWAEFSGVIFELRRDVVKLILPVFSRKITSFVSCFLIFKKIRPFDFRPNIPDPNAFI
jgi:hypothetical protein